MPHPAPYKIIMPNHLACRQIAIEFNCKAAHAAAFPWEGVNALDAAVLLTICIYQCYTLS